MANVTYSRAFWIRRFVAPQWFLLTLRVDSERFLYSSNSVSPCCLTSVSDKPNFDSFDDGPLQSERSSQRKVLLVKLFNYGKQLFRVVSKSNHFDDLVTDVVHKINSE